ncbi:C-GCAxxG-C-C family protein [Azoarcus sp. KH32C]|uniref:C-GCAxxG-C-C family protein n=1 Tax=Azoarcus sp. KH32C TaxID=748247 RepID=UPI0002385F12|nr:C-GCAxxG-C-C family protein [Azoarcus sp. KH32C]BAL25594.1 hypothetical protein AZKH_3305 [Azoarcus sp. KH32C]
MEDRPTSIPSSESVRQAAEDAFASGLYCAESVLSALAAAQGVKSELLPKVATAFCSGMARSCGPCGALTGALMGVGLALGRDDSSKSVQSAYAVTQELIRAFEHEFGARNCDELLGCDLGTAEGQTKFKDERLYERCRLYTGRTAEMAAQLLAPALS